MNIAIIYTSKHGTTEKVSQMIAENLAGHQLSLINLKKNPNPDLTDFDLLILGCGIYAGNASGSFRKFCNNNMNVLLNKELGLFICEMEPDTARQQQEIMNTYPASLLQHADAKAFVGGEFLFEEMNFMEKAIIKRIAKTDKSISAIKDTEIKKFTDQLIR